MSFNLGVNMRSEIHVQIKSRLKRRLQPRLAAPLIAAAAGLLLWGQDARIVIQGGSRPNFAIPDFRGDAAAQPFMSTFNRTLWSDIDGAGLFKMVPKTMYPTIVPQQPSDFKQPPSAAAVPRGRAGQQMSVPKSGGGLWLTDWSSPPASANYLAFGYAYVQNGVFAVRGWLFDVSRETPAAAEIFAKTYPESNDAAGAEKAAHEFAADILAKFGGKSLFGSHIYFVSNRTGHKEIWVMDPDGKNQKQLTRFNSDTVQPSVSPDGTKIAFMSYYRRTPNIYVFSVSPVLDLHFYNQAASVNETPSFTPDGKQIIYASAAGGQCCRLFTANLDGSGFRPVTTAGFIDVQPQINPKNPTQIAFASGRSGPEQVYRANIDGGDLERLSDGTGEAASPAWHPDGHILAFSWTRGFAAGAWNIFVMDVASRSPTQLTHGEGKNENPTWAPDGTHLAFASTRTGRSQIYTMLADGTQVQALTTAGENLSPSWGK